MGLRDESHILAFTLCVALASTPVPAQTSTTGTIEGIVADSTGAVVPGVTVNMTSPNLIRAQSATTDNEGRYRVLNLPPGRYTVTVPATAGFAGFVRGYVDVSLSKTSTVPIQLEPAGATTTVTVSSTAECGRRYNQQHQRRQRFNRAVFEFHHSTHCTVDLHNCTERYAFSVCATHRAAIAIPRWLAPRVSRTVIFSMV